MSAMQLDAILAEIDETPHIVHASADELRRLVGTRPFRVESRGAGVSKITRIASTPATVDTLDRGVGMQVVHVDRGITQPKAGSNGHNKSELRLALEALTLEPDHSVFVAYRESKTLYTICRAIRSTLGYEYRTHHTVRDGVQGTRLWRTK